VYNIFLLQPRLEYMSYFHSNSILYTPAAIIEFTNKCNSGKLNKDTYTGESNQIIQEKISLRRRMFIEAVESTVAEIMKTLCRPEPSGSTATKRRRVDNPAGGASVDGLNAKVAELEQRLGAYEAKEREAQATNAALEQRLGASEAKEREAQATIAGLEQRLGASEAKEREAQAKVVELEQRAVVSEVKVKELEQRLGASEAKEREAWVTIAGLEQRLGASEAKEREAQATNAVLEQRLGASESKEHEAQAKVVELEQRAVASEATIAELQQCLGATEAKLDELGVKVAAMEQQEKASVERERIVANDLEKARADMQDSEERYQKWKAFGEAEHENAKLWCQRAEKAEAKAVAWDEHIGRINDNLMGQAMGDYRTTPLQKMVNFAKLAGIVVQPADKYHEIRKNVLLKVHPDKRRCAFEKDALFERICIAVGEMPAHV
jgi:chromosome segregation ATPase